jgi:hypothetical protein
MEVSRKGREKRNETGKNLPFGIYFFFRAVRVEVIMALVVIDMGCHCMIDVSTKWVLEHRVEDCEVGGR